MSKDEYLPSVFDEWLEWQCDDEACSACREHANGLYEPATEPQMPPENCTCPDGCHCRYLHVPYPPRD